MQAPPVRVAADHASLRAFERHGIRPDQSDWAQAFLDIVEGRAIRTRVLDHQARKAEVYWVHVCGRDIHVVYLPGQARIVTVLPNGSLRSPRRAYSDASQPGIPTQTSR